MLYTDNGYKIANINQPITTKIASKGQRDTEYIFLSGDLIE